MKEDARSLDYGSYKTVGIGFTWKLVGPKH